MHAIAPFSTTNQNVALHHIPRTESRSKSFFTTTEHVISLQLDYQKSVAFPRDPFVRDWHDGTLVERVCVELNYIVPGKTHQQAQTIPLFKYDSGPSRRLVSEPSVNCDVHINFVGEQLEGSTITVVERVVRTVPFVPHLDSACAQSLPASPLRSGSNTPVDSPR